MLILIWINFKSNAECCCSNPSIDGLVKSNARDLNKKDVPWWEVHGGRRKFTAGGGSSRRWERKNDRKREGIFFFIKQMLIY